VENESHEYAVSLVKESNSFVKLNVISISNDDVLDVAVPQTCNVSMLLLSKGSKTLSYS